MLYEHEIDEIDSIVNELEMLKKRFEGIDGGDACAEIMQKSSEMIRKLRRLSVQEGIAHLPMLELGLHLSNAIYRDIRDEETKEAGREYYEAYVSIMRAHNHA